MNLASAWQSAMFDEQQRLFRRMLNFPRVVEMAARTRVGTTPHDVVLESGTHRLLRYRRQTPARHAQPVLICYALINRPYILDLQPDRSVIRRYLDQGFEVYLIDWGVPSDAERGLTLEDYVCGFMKQAVDLVSAAHGEQPFHLLGYCMGGTMAALFTALHPDRIRTLTLLAAPIDFTGRSALLSVWTSKQHFDVDAFVDRYGNCPAWFLQSCFLSMKPIHNFFGKAVALYEQMDSPSFVSNYFAMELWLNDNIPVAGETFRQFVRSFYQDNLLVQGRLSLGPHRIDLGRITCPLLLLTAKNDQLVPPVATEGIRPHVRSQDVQSLTVDAGHVGLVVGGKALATLWPRATRWLSERSTLAETADLPDAVSPPAAGPVIEQRNQ